MTINEAKQIPILDILRSCGQQPAKMTQTEAWFFSPFRREKTPSFLLNLTKNIWYDHGEGVGGTVIDLVCRLHRCSVPESLRVLDQNTSFSFSPAPSCSVSVDMGGGGMEILSVKELNNPVLLGYITGDRKIDEAVAKKYTVEVYFQKAGSPKNLFAVGFANDRGGYETRNKIYKGNIGGKAITTIRGKGNNKVAVFEGFIDFLSMLTKYNTTEATDDVIVLNSLSMVDSVMDKLDEYDEVKYFLDNDNSGSAATKKLIESVGGKDYSFLYANYKDANEWLIAKS